MSESPVRGRHDSLFSGVYPALVTSSADPQGLGRLQVRFPSLGTGDDADVRAWAVLCSPYPDADQHLRVMPEEGSQVVVAFGAGDFRRPYVVGTVWTGNAAPSGDPMPSGDTTSPGDPTPTEDPMPSGEPTPTGGIRLSRTADGNRIEIDDTGGSPTVSLTTRSGHSVVLHTDQQDVTITHSNGCRIRLSAAGTIDIDATSEVNVTAPSLNVQAPTSTFSGVVNCQTLVAGVGVISPMYSPGVGSLW